MEHISRVEPTELAGRLDMGSERKGESKILNVCSVGDPALSSAETPKQGRGQILPQWSKFSKRVNSKSKNGNVISILLYIEKSRPKANIHLKRS